MVTREESIPIKNNNYLIGEDIFYTQFNDLFIYIEDKDQENLFFVILKNIFPDIKLEKIFPLNGKDNVIKEANQNIGNKKKIYIVDKDFDDILNKLTILPNLFYLKRYSIENYLLEQDAIIKYIIGEKPKLKPQEILNDYNLDDNISIIKAALSDLIYLHLVVQKNELGIKNISLNYERFLAFNNGVFLIKENQILLYKNQIITELNLIDKRRTLNAQLKKLKKNIKFSTNDQCITHMPGKYIIKMIKQTIESKFGLVSRNIESFSYRIAEYCSFNSLNYLRNEIEDYI